MNAFSFTGLVYKSVGIVDGIGMMQYYSIRSSEEEWQQSVE